MTLAETIYLHSLNLPEPAAREVLDFIESLEQRYETNQPTMQQQSRTELFLAALAAGGLSDDFPDDIDDSDSGIDVPRQDADSH